MKKIFLILLLGISINIFSQQNPTYISDCYSIYVSEYSKTGKTHNNIMSQIQNDKLFFTSFAFSEKPGILKHGDKLILYFEPCILGIYNGDQIFNNITKETLLIIAGFTEAKSNKIIITHVFLDMDAANKWAESVKIVNF